MGEVAVAVGVFSAPETIGDSSKAYLAVAMEIPVAPSDEDSSLLPVTDDMCEAFSDLR